MPTIGATTMLDYAVSRAKELPVERGKQRVYAVIVDRKGRIISESANTYTKTHPTQKKYALKAGCSEHKTYLHAEMRAIIFSKGVGVKMYIARVGYKGDSLPGFPCPICQLALKDAGIKSVEVTV